MFDSFDSMEGLSIRCDTEEKLALVHSYEYHPDFDFLTTTKILGKEIAVLVAATSLEDFKTVLNKQQIDYVVFIKNVSQEIQRDYVRNATPKRFSRTTVENGIPSSFSHYPRYHEVSIFIISEKIQNELNLLKMT